MASLSVLIVEDEVLISEMIKLYLLERGHKIIDAVISYEEAVVILQKETLPDIILIDILLFGKKSGIDLAEYIKSNKVEIPVVFLTSHFDKMVMDKALTTHPQGYLTKPITKHTLWTTIEAAYNKYISVDDKESIILLNDGKTKHQCKQDDICYIEADHVYCKVKLKDRSIYVRNTLKSLLDELDLSNFVRCHRSFIVNVAFIKGWNLNEVILLNDEVIPISRTYRKEVIEQLEKQKLG